MLKRTRQSVGGSSHGREIDGIGVVEFGVKEAKGRGGTMGRFAVVWWMWV